MKLSGTYRLVVATSARYFPERRKREPLTGRYMVCHEQDSYELSSAVCPIGILFAVSDRSRKRIICSHTSSNIFSSQNLSSHGGPW